VAQSIAEEQLLGVAGVSYDVTRLAFIGRIAANVEVTYVWHTAAVKTLADCAARRRLWPHRPSSSIYPRLLNAIAA